MASDTTAGGEALISTKAKRVAPDAREKSKQKKKGGRRGAYVLHAWLGFHLAVIMSVVLFTGTFAVVSNEIDWLVQHDMRVSPAASPTGEMVSWNEMEAAARAFRPGHALTGISAMQGDHFAYRTQMYDEYGRRYFLHINQWTGEVTGVTHPLTVQRFFRDLHRYLFMPSVLGLPLVTSLAFVLGFSLYTGLKTTPNWLTAARRIRTHKGVRIAVGDAHKAAGVWGSWFFIVIIVTGVWYLLEFGGYFASVKFEPSRPRIEAARIEAFGPVIEDRSADEYIAAAKAAFPGLKPRSVGFAMRPGNAVVVMGRHKDFLVRNRANAVYLDPVDLSVLHIRRDKGDGALIYLNQLADPLHFGSFGGLPTKLIWFVFGLAMTGLSVTGVWLTWKRLKTTTPSKTQFATMPILIVAMLFSLRWYEIFQGPTPPDYEVGLAPQYAGAFRSRLYAATDENGAPTGEVRLATTAVNGRPNIKSVSFSLPDTAAGDDASASENEPGNETGADDIETKSAAALRVFAGRVDASAELPLTAFRDGVLSAHVILANGEEITYNWSLDKLEGGVPVAPEPNPPRT